MLGEGWYRRRELFTRCRGTRPFNSYGRNDNIVGGGEEWLENASSSTPACIVTLRDEFEKDNFSARFAIRREWNGRRMPRSVVADSFQTNFSRRFEREREEGGRPPFRQHSFLLLLLLLLLVGRSLVISIGPTLRLSSKCQSLVSRF